MTMTSSPHRPSFGRRTYQEVGYVFASLFTAIVGFVWTVAFFMLGTGTLVTALGFPVFALLLVGARGLGAVERGRVARLLGTRLPAPPAPVRAPGTGLWGRITAQLTDPAGWRAVAYHLLMFPWHLISFVLTVTFWALGFALALLPAYNWVFPKYVGWPGYRLYDFQRDGVHHVYYLAHFWQLAAASLTGFLLLVLAAGLTHASTAVSRRAAAALLSA
ncbi:sensor domain-containing protein [Kitasatospora sp. NBC_01266]|uniref:sensor domain-containing protein n=1 Tax=Kitasatospora sp. NBC_01266 TaxID=2903572 RepID=UPI002E379B7E|nr:sensor domain-containing protein [Kitasatospora sp. NBC_01266]